MALIEKIGATAADGLAINAWRIAQEFWAKGKHLVPSEIFFKLKHAQEIIDAGLADVRESFVYVRGSSEYLTWLEEKREQARIAGKKSAEARRKKSGSAQPKRPKTPKSPERTPNEPRTEVNDAEPSGSGSFSGSRSGSSSNSQVTEISNSSNSTNAGVAAYCDRFKLRWGDGPHIQGKDAGIVKRLLKTMSLDTFEFYLEAYFQMPDAGVVKAKHPLNLFELKMNEVVVFAKSGKFTTHREAREADSSATNAMLLEKVRKGEI